MTDAAERFVSYAQHGEDVILWRAFRTRAPGFYVDVGAFHPSHDSVTRALYERGWHGINLEPQADRIPLFEADRPRDTSLAVAIGDHDGTATLVVGDNPGWVRLEEVTGEVADGPTHSVTVAMRRLDSLFAELGVEHVDVLKVDVEGAEADVVRGLLAGPVRPVVCVIEGVAPATGRAAGDEAVELLVGAGYVHCLFDGLNHYLTIDEGLEVSLSVPANPLDHYTTELVQALNQERHDRRGVIDELMAQVAELQARLQKAPEDEAARARRREAFTRLIVSAPPVPVAPVVAGERETRASEMLLLAIGDHPPDEVVTILYRSVLAREADTEGRGTWGAHVAGGTSALALAEALADSPELGTLPESHRRDVHVCLTKWRTLDAAVEMGVVSGRAEMELSSDALFVAALFEVALGRAPTRSEIDFEVGKLESGCGRDFLLRAYAQRAELQDRVVGHHRAGLRSAVARWRARRRLLGDFTAMVLSAETARRSEIRSMVRAILAERKAHADAGGR